MTKILLIRHGHVEGIKPERFRGREPLELTAQGRAEAVAAANRIAGRWRPRTIYTSPMGRCVKTAEAVAKICAVAVQTCNDLNDLDYGAWQFKTFPGKGRGSDALRRGVCDPHLVRFPGGESLQDLAARTANASRLMLARDAEDTIVLVGHDNVNRVLLLQFLGLPLASYWSIEQGPCCVNEIDFGEGRSRVLRLNEMLMWKNSHCECDGHQWSL
ncbi:MAG: histidine phosphatase family protein, partial [Candidatus Acidiferrales bacterium]